MLTNLPVAFRGLLHECEVFANLRLTFVSSFGSILQTDVDSLLIARHCPRLCSPRSPRYRPGWGGQLPPYRRRPLHHVPGSGHLHLRAAALHHLWFVKYQDKWLDMHWLWPIHSKTPWALTFISKYIAQFHPVRISINAQNNWKNFVLLHGQTLLISSVISHKLFLGFKDQPPTPASRAQARAAAFSNIDIKITYRYLSRYLSLIRQQLLTRY